MPYTIHCQPNFSAGDIHGNDAPRDLASFYTGGVIVLADEADAQTLCRMLNDTPAGYVLAHNQYAAPEYTPRPARGECKPMSLHSAMQHLDLQHDFALDGSRLPAPAVY